MDGNDIDIPEIVLTNSTLSEMETYRHKISLEWKYYHKAQNNKLKQILYTSFNYEKMFPKLLRPLTIIKMVDDNKMKNYWLKYQNWKKFDCVNGIV